MSGLYQSGYTPIGVRKTWDRTSMSCKGPNQAGDVLRNYGAPDDWGDPDEAVAWWRSDGSLAVLVANYSNGRFVDLRRKATGFRISFPPPYAIRALASKPQGEGERV